MLRSLEKHRGAQSPNKFKNLSNMEEDKVSSLPFFSFLVALLELNTPSIVNLHRSAGLHSFSEHYEL